MKRVEPKKPKSNYAFIDSQNIYMTLRGLGWKLDWVRFRVYLTETFNVSKAFVFVGYIADNEDIYKMLRGAGFVLIFKKVVKNPDGSYKGNVDAELVLQAMIEYQSFYQAVIVSGDGDFACLVRYFREVNKLKRVLAPSRSRASYLLFDAAKSEVSFMDEVRAKIEYTKGLKMKRSR
jgi:uncharacterized LabA/DUF88 family protein